MQFSVEVLFGSCVFGGFGVECHARKYLQRTLVIPVRKHFWCVLYVSLNLNKCLTTIKLNEKGLKSLSEAFHVEGSPEK